MAPRPPARGPTVAIVGCGQIADAHVEQARAVGADVVAVCDIEPLMADQLGKRFGIDARYRDLASALDRHALDVVHVTTPPQARLDLARQALEAGVHVFLEKPLALDAAGAAAIVAAAEHADRLVAVNHWYDFEPAASALDRLVADGALGEVVHADSVFGAGDDNTFAMAAARPGHWVHDLPYGRLQNLVDHAMSKIVRLVPEPEAAVTAVAGGADFVIAAGPMTAHGLVTMRARPQPHRLTVFGTEHTAVVDFRTRTLVVEADPAFPSALGRLPLALGQAGQLARAAGRNAWDFAKGEFHFFEGMRRLLRRFYDAVLEGGPPPVAYADLVRVVDWTGRVLALGAATSDPTSGELR
jgi:predicted dehydrogenase